ncbi:hypothetical protein LSTR_LSTR012818 [Laodelphax striatellus]|uniref:Uncharacterized protein n=1 Tax=Laodelphax striatellus TaxID=195883 RepID=A0A482XDH5_LAOST|nr:hypothetical protein LSTR_LSTR012818 [Laodelphax striatellus]
MMGKWLTILLDHELLDNEVERIWKCAPREKTNRRSELAQFNTIYGFREGHAWSAVFNRHPRSPITRIERLSVTLCFLLNTMLLSLMFYGAVYEPNMDFATFTINLADILIAVECMIISFPPSFLIEYCFKKSRVELEEIDESEERKSGGCCGFLRYQIQSFLTFEPLQPVIVSTEIELMKKKQRCFFLGWFLCAFFILIDAYLIVLYSLKFGPKKSLNWLSAVMFGQFQETFVFEPVQVTLFAVLLAVIFRKQPGVATYKIKELKPEEMISSYYTPAIRNCEKYSPPTINKRKELKTTYLPHWEQKWLLFNLIVTSTMLILFGILIYQIDNTDLYHNTQHITNMLTAPKGHTIGFSNVTNHTDDIFLPSMFWIDITIDCEDSMAKH